MSIALDLPSPLYIGNAVTVTMTFTNPGSPDPVDPDTVSLQVQQGGASGSWVTYTYAGSQITKVDTGIYDIEITPTLAGQMALIASGTGACAAVGKAYIPVVATGGPSL